jgi:hypothetical protein
MGNEIKKAVKDVKDATTETVHRSNAELEREKRESIGGAMTPGEKAGSMAREAGEEAKAEYDRTKRNVRDST